MAEKATTEMERIYTIPLRAVKSSPRNHMADRAVRAVKKYLSRHMKSDDIWIDASVNEMLWARGMYTVPSRIRVRARKFDDGVVEVSLPDVEAADSIRASIKARQEAAEAEDKKETKEAGEKTEEPEAKPDEKPAAAKDEPAPAKAPAAEKAAPAKEDAAKAEKPPAASKAPAGHKPAAKPAKKE